MYRCTDRRNCQKAAEILRATPLPSDAQAEIALRVREPPTFSCRIITPALARLPRPFSSYHVLHRNNPPASPGKTLAYPPSGTDIADPPPCILDCLGASSVFCVLGKETKIGNGKKQRETGHGSHSVVVRIQRTGKTRRFGLQIAAFQRLTRQRVRNGTAFCLLKRKAQRRTKEQVFLRTAHRTVATCF